MTKKEDRLSPKARELVEGARKKFAHDPLRAIKYLQSVSPSELNMYDRQKIGREILVRAERHMGNYDGKGARFVRKLQQDYDLPITESGKVIEPPQLKERLLNFKHAKYYEKEMLKDFSIAEKYTGVETYGTEFVSRDFNRAVSHYISAGRTDKAIECYDVFIDKMEKNHPRWEPGIDLNKLKEERAKLIKPKNGGLVSRLSSVIAIAGVLGGIFFLSSNITGNAIANISQSSGNILGAVLLVVGLVASFFCVKKK